MLVLGTHHDAAAVLAEWRAAGLRTFGSVRLLAHGAAADTGQYVHDRLL